MAQPTQAYKGKPKEVLASIDSVAAHEAAEQKWHIRNMVRESRELKPSSKLVFWAISDLISALRPVARVSEETLADMTGLATRTVSDGIDELEAQQVLFVERRRGGFWVDGQGKRRGRANFYSLVPLKPGSAEHDSWIGKTQQKKASGSAEPAEKSLTYLESYNKGKRNSGFERVDIPSIRGVEREDVKRFFNMLDDEVEHGRWRFEREPKSTIPAEVKTEWERMRAR